MSSLQTRPGRLLAGALVFAALAGCAHAAPSMPGTAGASAVSSLATQHGRDQACQTFLAEYQGLDWYSYADRKKMLLTMIASTGSQIALQPLTQEYQGLDWYSYQDRKTLLMQAISKLSQVASQPCAPGATTSMQDQVCQTFLTEYQGLDWYSYADRKKLLLATIASTGSDIAVAALTQEYQGLDWYSYADRKQLLLDTLSKLLAVATPCGAQAPEELVERAKPKSSKVGAARQHLASVLQGELGKAPEQAKGAIQRVLALLDGR